jgi:hypothetical protein
MENRMSAGDTYQAKCSLWLSFVTIAQPYFFPSIRGGAWVTLLLMTMLLVFLFGLLFVIVPGIALLANHLAPELTTKIAPGMPFWTRPPVPSIPPTSPTFTAG